MEGWACRGRITYSWRKAAGAVRRRTARETCGGALRLRIPLVDCSVIPAARGLFRCKQRRRGYGGMGEGAVFSGSRVSRPAMHIYLPTSDSITYGDIQE